MKHTIENLKMVKQTLQLTKYFVVGRLKSTSIFSSRYGELSSDLAEVNGQINAVTTTISILESVYDDSKEIL